MYHPQMHLQNIWALQFFLLNGICAAPAPQSLTGANSTIAEISPVPSNITDKTTLDAALAAANGFAITGAASAYLNIYDNIHPPKIPDTISSVIAAAAISTSTSVIEATLYATLNGLSVYRGATLQSSNSSNGHENPTLTPTKPIFPQKAPVDAPYSLSDAQLRAAIHIPAGFTYGHKPPVVIVPGTGVSTDLTYRSNLFKLLKNSSFADIVWIDNPQLALEDAQINAEYVAYAVNFISGICENVNVSVIAWSQGTADTQWALKYWPSTNQVVTNFVALSPGFHGTQIVDLICSNLPHIPCDPSLTQQAYDSNWITALRKDDGDSAYVPTTSVYSSSDQIIHPQFGHGASGFISDKRQVGASNYEIQTVCANQPGGSPYTHEGVLFSPLAYALVKDALTNARPGDTSRLDLHTVCGMYAAPGLDLGDVLATESVFVVQGYNTLAYEAKVVKEPAIQAYAAGP